MASSLQWAAPKELSFDGNVRENFRKFEEHWNLFEKTELKSKSVEEKCSYFLLVIGERGREIYKTFDLPPETTTNQDGSNVWARTINQLKKTFRDYCNPRKNITYERHKFNTRSQADGESIDQYVTELQTLAATCEFGDLKDSLICDRIVCGINSQAMKERLLREPDLSFSKATDMCRASEISKKQIKTLTNIDTSIHALNKGDSTHKRKPSSEKRPVRPKQLNDQDFRQKKNSCRNCGHIHEPKKCPAFNKACNKCKKLGHFW